MSLAGTIGKSKFRITPEEQSGKAAKVTRLREFPRQTGAWTFVGHVQYATRRLFSEISGQSVMQD
jgi:hypothetical protein